MTTPTPPPPDLVEVVGPAVVADWMRLLGYTEEQVAEAEKPRPHNSTGPYGGYACAITENGWQCLDENGDPAHPIHDEGDAVAALVVFTLEHAALADRLLPQPSEVREEWCVTYGSVGGLWANAEDRAHAERLLAQAASEGQWSNLRVEVRTVSTYPGLGTLIGEWREVGSDE